jgi:hypothetical protein
LAGHSIRGYNRLNRAAYSPSGLPRPPRKELLIMLSAKDVLKHNMTFCRDLTVGFLQDLSDADLMARPTPTANHIAWQLGHLIASEQGMVAGLGHKTRPLPNGFAESHGKEASTSDDPKKFRTKAEYLTLFKQVREDTLAALKATPDADLEKPGPESMQAYAPTVMAVFNLLGAHDLMHAGQFTPVRRKLGKPVLF